MPAGGINRCSWDDGAAETAIVNFNRVASQLEALIAQRDQEVRAAMADYQADGVSAEYQAKEARWHQVAGQVHEVITALRACLEDSGRIAAQAAQQARAAARIG